MAQYAAQQIYAQSGNSSPPMSLQSSASAMGLAEDAASMGPTMINLQIFVPELQIQVS